ncbi:ABC transporter permease [Thermocrispum municipale]|jgi:ABC-2 type transport system permease protein|uniref:ABC transporter permease n=1 Tax=Thermocrispum municipale TaxID=37926 RepID=UPI000404CDF7|nr:ABC transporter permease [Thermocrispum municipale]
MTVTNEDVGQQARTETPSSSHSFKALSRAAFKGFIRDRATLFWTILFPLMFLVIFGLLFNDGGENKTELGVVGDGPVITALEKTGAVEITEFDSQDAALTAVQEGDVPGYVAVDGDTVTVRYAASNQASAGVINGLVDGVVNNANMQAANVQPRFTVDAQQVEDSSLEPIQYLTPGLLAWAVAMGAVFGSALTLVVWRKNQVLRRLRLAPVSPLAILSSRLTVSIGIAFVQAFVFIALALLPVFGLQLSGQWYLAVPLVALGTLAFFAIGMLVGSFSKTEESASGAANLVVLPMAFLSGSFFPIDQTPEWLQAVSMVLPMRHLNDGLSAVLVRGQGLEAILLPCGVLIAFAVVVGFIASRVFTWDDA